MNTYIVVSERSKLKPKWLRTYCDAGTIIFVRLLLIEVIKTKRKQQKTFVYDAKCKSKEGFRVECRTNKSYELRCNSCCGSNGSSTNSDQQCGMRLIANLAARYYPFSEILYSNAGSSIRSRYLVRSPRVWNSQMHKTEKTQYNTVMYSNCIWSMRTVRIMVRSFNTY